jgi:acetolactate synthase small subunit
MTAVEKFIEQLEAQGESWENVSIGRIQISINVEDYLKLIEQAKEMEKEKIINALIEFSKTHFDIHTEEAILNITRRAEKYYNETFKKQETETYPCPQCQGGGCPYCCGYGTIPK